MTVPGCDARGTEKACKTKSTASAMRECRWGMTENNLLEALSVKIL
jgi:hypothetical protein